MKTWITAIVSFALTASIAGCSDSDIPVQSTGHQQMEFIKQCKVELSAEECMTIAQNMTQQDMARYAQTSADGLSFGDAILAAAIGGVAGSMIGNSLSGRYGDDYYHKRRSYYSSQPRYSKYYSSYKEPKRYSTSSNAYRSTTATKTVAPAVKPGVAPAKPFASPFAKKDTAVKPGVAPSKPFASPFAKSGTKPVAKKSTFQLKPKSYSSSSRSSFSSSRSSSRRR